MDTVALLTDVIKSRVCGAPLSLSPLSEEAARELFALAKKQDLAHIAGDALCGAGLLPMGKAKSAFEKEAFAAFGRYSLMQKELEGLCAILEAACIPHLPLKGAVLRAYYPEPWMRNSCDIDILVKEEDFERAKAILLEKGYRFFAEETHDAGFDAPTGVHVELHFCLLEKSILPKAERMLGDPWKYAYPAKSGGFCHLLPDDIFYLYHIAHMAKHYLKGGCGIRPFLDLWVLNHISSGDRAQRESALDACALLPFAKAAEALAEFWFGAEESTPLTDTMARFVVAGGVYGSKVNLATAQKARSGGRFSHILRLVFKPYSDLKYEYPILKKHKWLYPFCLVLRWIKRIFAGSFGRLFRTLFLSDARKREDPDKITRKHLKALGF